MAVIHITVKRAPLLLLACLISACQTPPAFTGKDIVGAWQADSVFHYTNGFVERKAVLAGGENITYVYDSTGRLTMKKDGEQRYFRYDITEGDSLIYQTAGGEFMVGYRILALSPDRLVLRKDQRPVFSGKNQEVYDIRLFSPVPAK